MYEVRSLAVRKSPSMPTLDVSCGGESTSVEVGKCRKVQRRVKSAAVLCVGVFLCCVAVFVLLAADPMRVAGPRMVVEFPSAHHHQLQQHYALIEEGGGRKRRGGAEEEVPREAALEGMGMLFRHGTRAMPDVVVAHLSETTTPEDLRVFLRGLHRSGMPARADVVLLFPFRPVPENLMAVIREEEEYFQRLLATKTRRRKARKPLTIADGRIYSPKLSPFSAAAYIRTPESVKVPSIWAKRTRNATSSPEEEETVHFGAVVGFDVQELDPDDALSGFLDKPSMSLRRWICYQMLLGMVRHHYRHVLLTEVAGVVILKDVLALLKKKDANLHLYYTGNRWADKTNGSSSNEMESVYGQSFWNSLEEEDKSRKVICTGIIVGGIRPVRSVATAMATEIVRVAMLRKSREPFRVEALLSYLVHKSSALGRKVASHLQVHECGTSSVNLLPGPTASRSDDLFRKTDSRFAVIQGLYNEGTSETRRNKVLASLKKDICRSQNDLEIYSDCYALPEAVIDMMIQ